MSVTVSVVMSVYQEDQFLSCAIDSILHQTFENFEFIIINDNPEDASLKKSLERYKQIDSRIVLIENEKNLGLGASLNRGLAAVQGEFIARMDSDDIALPLRLEKQVNYLNEHTDIALVGSWAQRIDENGNDLGIMSLPESHSTLKQMLPFTTASFHPTWMFRRYILNELSNYRHFPVAQDYDFLYRAIDKGFKLANIQEILLHYRVTSTNLSVKNFMDQWNCRKYIQRLHRERLNNGDDSFSIEQLNAVLNVNPMIRKLYNISHYYYEKSVLAKRTRDVPKFIFNLVLSLLIYPGKISVLYGAYRSKKIQKEIK
jgi:glycosyltransferase involved in cell wall biosynthesis